MTTPTDTSPAVPTEPADKPEEKTLELAKAPSEPAAAAAPPAAAPPDADEDSLTAEFFQKVEPLIKGAQEPTEPASGAIITQLRKRIGFSEQVAAQVKQLETQLETAKNQASQLQGAVTMLFVLLKKSEGLK